MVVGSAAAIYSLPGTKLNGIDPESYLRSVMSPIGDHPIGRIEELHPANVAASLPLGIFSGASRQRLQENEYRPSQLTTEMFSLPAK
jgi:hypothetical protein